jgi:hypothetical protein
MPTVQEWWKKLNANERMVATGALITIVAWLIGVVTGGSSLGFIAGLAVLIIYWLKYSPNQITWPAPIQTIVLIVAGVSALFGVLGLITLLSFFGAFAFLGGFFLGAVIALILNAIGAVMMALGAWREYQAMPKAAPPAPPAGPPPAPPAS